jgi:peptide/nickel transport system substrate-binding protein
MSLTSIGRKTRTRSNLWLPIIGIVACIAGAIILAILSTILSEPETDDKNGITVEYGLTFLPSGFDPHLNRSVELGIPFYSVYDTLIYRHPQTFEFIPGLAERWEISPDGLTYTFFLRHDVTFHDNTRFDANAVGVTFDRITDTSDPATVSQKARIMLGAFEGGPYAGYSLVDDYTFQIQLSTPYAPLLDALSQPYFGIASPTAVANTERTTYQYNQIGTGPYKLAEFIPGDRIVLERNEDYSWGPPYYTEHNDHSIERYVFRFYENPNTRRIGLEAGDIDIVGELPPNDAERLLNNRDAQLLTPTLPGQPLQFFFNTQQFPTNDIKIRQAILSATNREAIVQTVFFEDFSPVAYGPITTSMPYYTNEVENFYGYSPEIAQTLFSSAGVVDSDEDSILDVEGRPLQLKVVFLGTSFLPEVTQLLQSQWREIGLDVELVQVASFGDLLAYTESGDYNLIAFQDWGTDPSIINRFYLSDGDSNWTGYTDTELDNWLLQAVERSEPETRQQLYTNIQLRIMDQALILPIRDNVNLIGWSQDLDGLVFAAQGWWPLLTNIQSVDR